MSWSKYMVMAAQHSKNNAQHWFRYLRKDITKCGITFTKEEMESLCKNELLTPFQRVSLKVAFEDNSLTRQYIIGLNRKVTPSKLAEVRAKCENTD